MAVQLPGNMHHSVTENHQTRPCPLCSNAPFRSQEATWQDNYCS